MDSIILKTNALTKTYKNVNVLENVNITIKKGQIYGLIGLNGAGKTTLIKLITGLALKTSGSIELFGESEEKKLGRVRRRIGAVIELPGVYTNNTVYENMNIDRMQKGIPGKECIEKLLDMLGLKDVKNKKVKSLSLGMKQRLGIAMALLGDPEFLVLDEPINAVDPMGVIEIRELLKSINEEKGVTILISSHILGELCNIASCYGIIHKGRLIEDITAKELKEKCKRFLHIKVNDAAKASVIINKNLLTSKFEVFQDNVIKLYDYVDSSDKVATTLFKEGIIIREIMPMGDDLEAYFLKKIGGKEND